MKYILLTIIAIIILAGAVFILNKPKTQNTAVQSVPSPSPTVTEKIDINATFAIITGNIIRNFSAQKYHNQSPDVYIEASDSTIVHVRKQGITWGDFFSTLPMKLTKDCLTTGDEETFCTGDEGTLKFYLNDKEDPKLLEKEIKEGDKALIRFSN